MSVSPAPGKHANGQRRQSAQKRNLRAAGALLVVYALSAACSSKPCNPDPSRPNDPSPAVECPAGDLCYRGECIAGCNAAQERLERCDRDSDCGSSRPKCVDEFCSACGRAEVCVLGLNVCGSVSATIFPDAAPVPTGPFPPSPLDGGVFIGHTFNRDGSTAPPPELDVSHLGFIDVFTRDDMLASMPPTRSSTASIEVVRVAETSVPQEEIRRGSFRIRRRSTGSELFVETGTVSAIGDCEVVRTQLYTDPTPAHIGDIKIASANDFPGSIAEPLSALFTLGNYQVTTAIPTDLLKFSIPPSDPRQLAITSQGLPGIVTAWPVPNVDIHVPFELNVPDETSTLLSTPIPFGTSPQDLRFAWDRIGQTGAVPGERIKLRLEGARHDLVCTHDEFTPGSPSSVTVRAGLLNEFAALENLAGTSIPLFFERAMAVELPLPANRDNNIFIRVTVRVRHTLIGSIQF